MFILQADPWHRDSLQQLKKTIRTVEKKLENPGEGENLDCQSYHIIRLSDVWFSTTKNHQLCKEIVKDVPFKGDRNCAWNRLDGRVTRWVWNNCLNDAQRTKGRFREGQENDVGAK